MPALPLVREYMDHFVNTLRPETDIFDAVEFLLERRVTGAPVVDAAGRLVGIISEKDCLRLLAQGFDHQAPHGTVADYMTRNVETVKPDMDVYFAAGIFLRGQFRRLPVVEGDMLVGAITRFDILRAIKSRLRPETEPGVVI
ncbi:CBS domain-containing protein [Myxococcota bacterium]|nr:CBS domain-containing protein [Myxococcota bacterium]